MQDVALVSMVQAAADVDEESTVGGGMKGEGRRGGGERERPAGWFGCFDSIGFFSLLFDCSVGLIGLDV